MKIGEVCLLTNDVVRLADFYKKLLEVDNGSCDEAHQTLIVEETMLTVYNDGTQKNNQNQNICLAFTVDDIQKAYAKVASLGAEIIEPPTARPWGAVNMSFYDPDGNTIYLRVFPKLGELPESEMSRVELFESVPENYTYDTAEEARDLERIEDMLRAYRE